jgi:hypothetical protein
MRNEGSMRGSPSGVPIINVLCRAWGSQAVYAVIV